ncbi:MAG: site-2 protease family protein [Alphaproteobacteria bacterium]|nr:site-2 protease family protein [Alphaproteobacteria bacterium]
MEWILDAAAWVIPVVLAITLHEAAHGWMANKFGDDTAKTLGRVTFNPLKHIDRYGTIILPGLLFLANSPVLFGYAKPVPVNFYRLRPARIGMLMVALAGPVTNVILALIAGALLHLDQFITPEEAPFLFQNLYRAVMINSVLAVFNMLPILPLDGGRVVDSMLSGRAKYYFGKIEPFGIYLVMAALIIPQLLGIEELQGWLSEPVMWLAEQVLWATGNGQ